MALWWPLDAVNVTGGFGNGSGVYTQYNSGGHNGIDLGCGIGTPVYAADDGVIQFEGWGQNHSWMGKIAGISVLIRHPWGYTGYAHMSDTVINNGQAVARGQLIGHSGSTGGSTGPHLHFETLPPNPNFSNGFAGRVNPSTYGLVARGASSGSAPASLAANQRQVKSDEPANRRLTPDRSKAPIAPQLAKNEVGDFDGFIRGESVDGNNIWFRGAHSGNYFWSGCFTSTSTNGLSDLGTYAAATPAPAPAPAPVPVPASNTLKPLCDIIPEWNATADEIAAKTYETQPKLADMELPAWITERHREPGLNGYKKGRPGQPNHAVIHHAWTDSLNSAVNTLQGDDGDPTANYVIGEAEVVSMVDEGDSPFTNGRIGSNIRSITFELINWKQTGVYAEGDPVYSAPSELTLETAAYVFARAMIRHGWTEPAELNVNVFGHEQVSKKATSCPGDTDLAYIVKRANEIITEHRTQKPEQTEQEKPMPELTKEEIAAAIAQQQTVTGQIKPVDIGSIIKNNTIRKAVWATYGVVGLVLVGGIGGLTAIQALAPEWFMFTVGAYAALGPAFSSLAIANIYTKK